MMQKNIHITETNAIPKSHFDDYESSGEDETTIRDNSQFYN